MRITPQRIWVRQTLFWFVLGLSVQAQDALSSYVKAPPGSYRLTCSAFEMHGSTLKATCQTVNGDWLTTELHDADRCNADIANNDGKLACYPGQGGRPAAYLEAFSEGSANTGDQAAPSIPSPGANWQLRHDTWTFKDGAPENVAALAQTDDGLLWLGSPEGLYRFDGRQFELFHSPYGEQLLSTNIRSLYAPPSGGLWIGYMFGGASFVDKGRVKNYAGDFFAGLMVQDKDGIVWAAGAGSGLWRFEHSWQHIGTEWNVPLKSASEVALDRQGNLWVHGDRSLLCLHRGSRRFEVVDNAGSDAEQFASARRLTDREGNVWFGSQKGLDRFFYSPLIRQDVPGDFDGFAFGAADSGAILVGASGGAFYRIDSAGIKVFPKGLSTQFMYRAPDSTIWLGIASGDLWHESLSHQSPFKKPNESNALFDVRESLWRFTGRDWNKVDLPSEVANHGSSLQAITQDRSGAIWLSLGRRGLYRLANGSWTSYGGHTDLPTTGVLCEFTDSKERVWFGYRNNVLAVLEGDRVRVIGPNNGIRIGNIMAIYGRGPNLWIGGDFGLEFLEEGRFRSISAVNNDWLRGISGIIETANGDLWLNGLSGIFHIPQSELAKARNDSSYQVKGDHFGRREGAPGFASQLRPLPSAVEGTDGRLWFGGSGGVAWLDPTQIEHQVTPPPIKIQSVSADDITYDPTTSLRLPASTSSVQISYTTISLSDPDLIRSRYKLQETDTGWHEVSTTSPISYRNLAPGSYHFIVDDSDTNGNWSPQVTTTEFTILPAFYQTLWFRSLSIIVVLAMVAALYQLRLRQLAKQYGMRLEERVNERTRIARELHDTLLQSLHGLMFQFQAARNMLPRSPEGAMETLDEAISSTRGAIAESRDAIHDLRSQSVAKADLAELLEAVGEQLADTHDDTQVSTVFRVIVEGEPQELSPILQDEVYRIACELMRNAFRHAGAKQIEVEIRYDQNQLRLRVRDDGKGIDPEILEASNRRGHWGLPGVNERAQRSGARLRIWSEAGAGTEVELTVPSAVAYRHRDHASRFKLFG